MNNNNQLIVVENGAETRRESFPGLQISWLGSNGTLKIHADSTFKNCHFQIGTNSIISVGPNSLVSGMFIRCAAENSEVKLGKRFIFHGGEFILARGMKNQSVKVGDYCLFSSQIALFSSDGHTLLDKNTKQILNFKGGNISIGDHCWIGYNVTFLKGASLANDVVVGSGSLVTTHIDTPYCLVTGQPARIVRQDVAWDIACPADYEKRLQTAK